MNKIILSMVLVGMLFLTACETKEQIIQPYEEQINQLTEKNINLNTENNNLKKEGENLISFFTEYAIALNDIYIGRDKISLASTNLDVANDYTLGAYTHFDAKRIYDTGKTYALDGKELLIKADVRLKKIQNNSPTLFYEEEIDNRLEQIRLWILFEEKTYLLIDYMSKHIYEVNYGDKDKATKYFNMYNNLVPKLNKDMKDLSDVQNKIDLVWDKDWYVTFPE